MSGTLTIGRPFKSVAHLSSRISQGQELYALGLNSLAARGENSQDLPRNSASAIGFFMINALSLRGFVGESLIVCRSLTFEISRSSIFESEGRDCLADSVDVRRNGG
jgi:hypothetical protein